MNQPRTLHQYLEMRSLQRKRENYLVNQTKNFPNPLSLDKQKKIDSLMIEILDYFKHIAGQGPIFHRFRIMMQNLYKIFQKELTEFHNIGIANKFNTNQAYIEEMKKANFKLKEYLYKCEGQNKEIDTKLEHLVKGNKQLNTNMIFIKKEGSHKVQIEDNFQEDLEKPEKIVKIGKIETEASKKPPTPNPFFTINNKPEQNRPIPNTKGSSAKNSKEIIPQFITKI